MDRLAKLDMNLLTILCIRQFTVTIDQLLALTKIRTLTALNLEQVGLDSDLDGPTAKTIRDWGRAACEQRAFEKLKLLVLGNFHLGTDAIIQGVSSFPALCLLGIYDSLQGIPDPRSPSVDWCSITSQW